MEERLSQRKRGKKEVWEFGERQETLQRRKGKQMRAEVGGERRSATC